MTRNSSDSLKSDEAMAAALGLQRPKRQRNPTTYYTDDKPNTFTTKRYRGQFVYGPSGPNPSYSARDDGAPASSTSSVASSAKSETGRMANGTTNNEQKKQQQRRRGSASSAGSTSSTAGIRRGAGRPPAAAELASASLSPPNKRGPGRPPKRSKSLENPAVSLLGKVTSNTDVSSVRPPSSIIGDDDDNDDKNKKPAVSSSSTRKRSTSSSSSATDRNSKVVVTNEEENDDGDDEDEVEDEPTVKRKRGRPAKNRAQEDDDSSKASSSIITNARRRTSMTSNRPSHRHATRGGGVANLIRPIEKPAASPRKSSSMPSRGKKGTTAASTTRNSNLDDDGDEKGDGSTSARRTRLKNGKDASRGGALSPTSSQNWRSSLTSHLTDASMSPGRKLLVKGKSNKPSSIDSTSDDVDDVEGTFLSHSVTVAPILPPVLIGNDNLSNNNNNSTAIIAMDIDDEHNNIDEELLRSRFPVAFESGVPPGCSKTTSFANNNKNQTSSSSSLLSSSSISENILDALPSWTPLYNPPIFFEEDYDAESGLLDLKTTLPVVSRKITAVAVRQPQHDYLVLGDSIGFITVYSLMSGSSTNTTGPRPVARLESVACQQRGRVEQERIRADILRRRKGKSGSNSDVNSLFYSIDPSTNALVSGTSLTVQRDALGPTAAAAVANEANTPTAGGAQQLRSILMNTTDTNIHALAMIANRVVLATQIELECMDVPSGTSLWVCPLSTNRIVTSVDMHLSTYDVLVSCSKLNDTSNDELTLSPDASASIAGAPVSPLMLLQHSKDNIEICDANSPMLVRSSSCTAIWDCGNENRLLFVALSSNRQELELVLVSGGTIDTWKVACKTKIPSKTPAHATTSTTNLSQSSGGHYTLVACTRGIRLYQTETLQLINVYGDQLALHGQSVNWKDCWLAGSYFHEGENDFRRARLPSGNKSSAWLECNDWVSTQDSDRRLTNKNGSVSSMLEESKTPQPSSVATLPPYIIGVPHMRKNGPKELCEKLHVWKVEHSGVVPAMSIPLPAKAEGTLGLVGSCGKSSSDDRLVLVTDDGQGYLLLPRLESNFAGTMYPPGYQIVTDNIEYIENEDALDETPCIRKSAGEGSDSEGEEEDANILAGENEDMDEELREAMRQSLLELKKENLSKDAEKQNDFVDVLTTRDADYEVSYVPCRPEPYLRQAMNSQSDDEEKDDDEKALCTPAEQDGQGLNHSKGPKIVSSEAFVSNILNVMPNKERPQETVEEDCLSFTTTKVVMALNPVVPARPGRGRKGRIGNLDALIKASINPYLQSLMISKQSIPSNGSGSRAKVITRPESSTQITNQNLETIVENAGMASNDHESETRNGMNSLNTIHLGTAGTSSVEPSANVEAEVALGLLGLSPCNTSRPSDVSIGAVPSAPKLPTAVETYLNAASLSDFASTIESSVVSAINAPLNGATDGPPESIATSSDRGSICGDFDTSTGDNWKLKHKVDISCLACRGRQVMHSCCNRSLPIDYDEVAKVERERKAKEEEDRKRARAEKRRLADQRRREAKKQKQRDLEQQRLRDVQHEKIEIERQQRLQDDFASQDLNRLRRDQIVASYATHLSHMRDSEHVNQQQLEVPRGFLNSSSVSSAGKSVVEPSKHVSTPHGVQHQGVTPFARPASAGEAAAAAANAASNVSSHQFSSVGNQTALQGTLHATGSYAIYNGSSGTNGASSSHGATAPPPNAASATIATTFPRSPPQSATLASADALVALATFAGASQALATSPAPAPTKSVDGGSLSSYHYSIPRPGENGESSWSSTSVVAANTTHHHLSHGFNTSMPSTSSAPFAAPQHAATAEGKRSIPSYAAIRGQMNGDPTCTPNQTVMATQPVTADSLDVIPSNGGRTTVETYVWPARQDAAADAALAMTALGSMLMGNSTNSGRHGNESDQNQSQ